MSAQVVVREVPPAHPVAQRVLRAYIEDVAGRWYGRPATSTEVDQSLREDPSDHLQPPTGVFLVAFGLRPDQAAGEPAAGRLGDGTLGDRTLGDRTLDDGEVLGCGALHLVGGSVAEVKRLFVVPSARRRGVASALLEALERRSRRLGVATLRLDTRHDLTEALALYERRGYRDVAAFNAGPYAQRWLAKDLTAPE